MTPIETTFTTRNIGFIEYDPSKNWIKNFPTENWCLIVIANEKREKYFDEIIRKSIDRDVGYICAIGKQHRLIHNLADEILIYREVESKNYYLPTHTVMTVGDDNFENGLWFGLTCTFNDKDVINEIVILDLTKSALELTIELIKRFENGYLPED